MTVKEDEEKVSFEEALNEAGFGLYSYLISSLAGLMVISFVCIAYSNTMITPTSACELETTSGQRGLLASMPVVGMILGSLASSYVSDVIGRRLTLLICLTTSAIVNALSSISVNWIMLMILQLVATFLSAGQYPMSMTLLSESVPMIKRNMVVLVVGSIFLLSQGIMSALAIPIIPLTFSYEIPVLGIYWNSWRTLLLVYSAPSIVSAFWLFFMCESPKFVFAKGREEEAVNILKKIHRLNHLGSKTEFTVKSIVAETSSETTSSKSAKDQILPLFKSPLLKNTIILTTLFLFQQVLAFIVWLPTIANTFIESLNTGEISNLTLCHILNIDIDAPPDPDAVPCSLNVPSLLVVLSVSALLSVTNIFIAMIIRRVGHRNIIIFVTALCGVCGILVNLVPNAIGSAVMFIAFLLGAVTYGLYTAMAVALYPTYLRTLAIALTMTGNRLGTFAAVQILNVLIESNCEVGFYVFSALLASSAIVAAFLPDDRILQKENQ
ncbi:unnamed protein product [Euphydryas editha]|uniref:Major facilitator superfamily (MFS) profile domain-containing protein n=1 Tax=Euphydryas editha TaxID=104508 RepID=A0AAU9TK11_EUPED|nr:unnamed protein product [Euphydryas editha]